MKFKFFNSNVFFFCFVLEEFQNDVSKYNLDFSYLVSRIYSLRQEMQLH